jgi:hypothetical protein
MDDRLIANVSSSVTAPARPFCASTRNVATPGSRATSDGAFALDEHPFKLVTR